MRCVNEYFNLPLLDGLQSSHTSPGMPATLRSALYTPYISYPYARGPTNPTAGVTFPCKLSNLLIERLTNAGPNRRYWTLP